MDLTVLPDLLSLAVFLGGLRPLVRRVGAHADLWFLGWFFVLLHTIVLLLMPAAGSLRPLYELASIWALDICALSFLLAAARTPPRPLQAFPVMALAVTVLVQSGLTLVAPAVPLLRLTNLLFIIPLVFVLLRRTLLQRPALIICAAFALFGTVALIMGEAHPRATAEGVLSLLFLSAAYLCAISGVRWSRGKTAMIAGLAGWGLTYPAGAIFEHLYPGLYLNHALLAIPRYLVVAGVIITLLEERVSHTERLAMHDSLTDLPNRRMFEQRLAQTMREARLNRTTLACLVIDIDNFKTINDTLGHTAGDELLCALAVRLGWHMSPRDMLARTGGDEFTALLAGVNDEHHLRFVASAMMSAASVPVIIDGQSVDVRISVGIALSPDHADDGDGLRRLADEAMYSAKRRGGSLLAFAGESETAWPVPRPPLGTSIR